MYTLVNTINLQIALVAFTIKYLFDHITGSLDLNKLLLGLISKYDITWIGIWGNI